MEVKALKIPRSHVACVAGGVMVGGVMVIHCGHALWSHVESILASTVLSASQLL